MDRLTLPSLQSTASKLVLPSIGASRTPPSRNVPAPLDHSRGNLAAPSPDYLSPRGAPVGQRLRPVELETSDAYYSARGVGEGDYKDEAKRGKGKSRGKQGGQQAAPSPYDYSGQAGGEGSPDHYLSASGHDLQVQLNIGAVSALGKAIEPSDWMSGLQLGEEGGGGAKGGSGKKKHRKKKHDRHTEEDEYIAKQEQEQEQQRQEASSFDGGDVASGDLLPSGKKTRRRRKKKTDDGGAGGEDEDQEQQSSLSPWTPKAGASDYMVSAQSTPVAQRNGAGHQFNFDRSEVAEHQQHRQIGGVSSFEDVTPAKSKSGGGQSGGKADKRSKKQNRAAVRLQCLVRRFVARCELKRRKRRKLFALAARSGVLLACEGTVQGGSGWYQQNESSIPVYYEIDSRGQWRLRM